MDESRFIEYINNVNTNISSKLQDLKLDIDKKFEKLFADTEDLKGQIVRQEMEIKFLKENINDYKSQNKEDLILLWKALAEQKLDYVKELDCVADDEIKNREELLKSLTQKDERLVKTINDQIINLSNNLDLKIRNSILSNKLFLYTNFVVWVISIITAIFTIIKAVKG